MPGSCQRLRLPSLTSVLKSTRANSADYPSSSTTGAKRCNTSTTHSSNLTRKQQHRIVVMGAAKVGKTCIISQFLYDKFNPRYKQTVEELHRGEYDLPDGSALTLDILDTSGSYEFPAMRTLSISSGAAFVLVYDVNDRESWCEVERLRNLVSTNRFVYFNVLQGVLRHWRGKNNNFGNYYTYKLLAYAKIYCNICSRSKL